MVKAWFKTEHPSSDHVLLQAYLGRILFPWMMLQYSGAGVKKENNF